MTEANESEAPAVASEMTAGSRKCGAFDKRSLSEFEAVCLDQATPPQFGVINAKRESHHVSQAVFALPQCAEKTRLRFGEGEEATGASLATAFDPTVLEFGFGDIVGQKELKLRHRVKLIESKMPSKFRNRPINRTNFERFVIE